MTGSLDVSNHQGEQSETVFTLGHSVTENKPGMVQGGAISKAQQIVKCYTIENVSSEL